MRILETPKPTTRRERRWRRTAALAALVTGALAWTALVFLGGMTFLDYIRPSLSNLTGTTDTAAALRSVASAPRHLLGGVLRGGGAERLVIDVKFKNLTKIHEKRLEALEDGILMSSGDDLVPAEIRHGDRTVRVRVRLKGDYTDHFEGDKWSLRVETRGGDQLFGMRRFSLQAPRTRGYQGESVVMEHLRREGVLAPRYFFVGVTLNGKDLGLMAVEEHFSKELLESQRRREGVIVRFDEDPFFRNRLQTGVHGPFDNPAIATITPFRGSQVAGDPRLSRQRDTAIGLLRAFVTGEIPASEAFDVDLVARFLAIGELWRTQHLFRWHNLRFYFNPITQRLEPVAFDANLHYTYVGHGLVSFVEDVSRHWLEDPVVRAAFVAHLHRITGELVEGDLGGWLRDVEAPYLDLLHREFPFRSGIDFAALTRRAARLRDLDPDTLAHLEAWGAAGEAYANPVRAYLVDAAEGPQLELVNALPLPVTVGELHFTGVGDPPPPVADGAAVPLPPTPLGGVPTTVRVSLAAPSEAAEGFGIEGESRVAGQSRSYPLEAVPYVAPLRAGPIPRATRAEALAAHAFLSYDEAEARFRIGRGTHRVEGSLVLPEGAALDVEAGARLQFGAGEMLLASGPLRLRGRADAVVVLEPWPEVETWGGIVVLGSSEPYAWEHAEVRSTSGIERGSWVLTGGVTLHESEVRLASVRFAGNRTEDALNLVRCRFVLDDIAIEDTPSDAFDADFSDGEVLGGSFSRIGGDGIDVSGARIVVEGTRIDEVRDKAVSVGEGSHLEARGLHISRTGTAVASKDRSEAIVLDSRITDVVHVALMAYVKKPEYGPASIRAEGITFERVGREALAQTGSRVQLDGREVEPEDVDVDSLYEGGYMRK
jgi:hypothetical protein